METRSTPEQMVFGGGKETKKREEEGQHWFFIRSKGSSEDGRIHAKGKRETLLEEKRLLAFLERVICRLQGGKKGEL